MNTRIELFVLALVCAFLILAATPDKSIVVIVNNGNPVEKLSASEAKLYWLRKVKKRWPTINKNILPADRKTNCEERQAFYSKVLNMSADDVESYFSNRQYQNAEKPQDKFNTDAEVIEFVSNEAGAIGFVSASSLTASNKGKVKVILTID